ncbi:MAG: protein kinase [Lentisphaeraceae bacterium]|nr:protein kinase [Lentisphaeraceae bacterium]
MKDFLALYDESDNYQPSPEESSPMCEQLAKIGKAYTDEVVIAQGGMKSISKVFCASTQRYVAKATLNNPEKLELRDAFIREARLTALLDHPNIIKIYDIALSEKGEPFFTMELKTGSCLSKYLKEPHSKSDLLGIFIKICDAIAYAHSRQILHLDLKPENIQVGSFGEVIVCDWGIGRILTTTNTDEQSDLQLDADMLNHCTLYGEAKGTPGYMAPEQLTGTDKSEQTDIYSLGALLFTLLSPERFKGKSTQEVLAEKPQQYSLEMQAVPESLKAVINKAMSVDKAERYESVEALQSDILLYLNEYPTEAQGAGFLTQANFFWRRNRRICQTLFSAILIIIIGLLFFLNRLSQSEQQTALALKKSQEYAAELEKTLSINKGMTKSLKTLPKTIVGRIVAQNQEYRDYQLLMTPKVSLQRSNQFLKAAYKTEPENIYVIRALAANHFISMNFKELDTFYKTHTEALIFFKDFIEDHTEDGSIQNLPKSFATFKKMTNFSKRIPVLMELVVSQHADIYRSHGEFIRVIHDLIRNYYPEVSKLVLNMKGQSLELWAPNIQRLTSPTTKLSLLRYLKFKDLFIANNDISSANEFAGLNLRKLHLQHTKIRDLSPLLKLTTLDHVTVLEDQVPEQQLAEFSKHFSKELVQVYEAEHANISGGAKIYYNHKSYTSGGFVAGMHHNSEANITFTLNSKENVQEDITLRYSAGFGDAKIVMTVNGQDQDITLKTTGDWEQWKSFQTPVLLSKGSNKINIRMKTSANQCINLDSISRKIQ